MNVANGNELRGEVRVTIEGVDYVLRPVFQALVSIEGRLGIGIMDLIRRGLLGRPHLRDLAAVMSETSLAAGREIPIEVLGRFILEHTADAASIVGKVLDGAFPRPSSTAGASDLGKAPPPASH